MSIAIIYPKRDVRDWVAALHETDPALAVEVWPDISDPAKVEFALCWNQPAGVLRQFPNLKAVSSLGAGVNHLLNDPACPADVPLLRLVDDELKRSMAEYVVLGVLEHFRQFGAYRRQQALGKWAVQTLPHASEVGVGIMGCGELGEHVAHKLAIFGFSVCGWTRRPKEVAGVPIFAGQDRLGAFLAKSNILVCMLPLTRETANILDAQAFRKLPPGAYLINVARGAHLVDDDLLAALDAGQLSGALLDVFREEPLPPQHPFWTHDRISVTPHIASITNPLSAARQVVENYHRVVKGREPFNLVDRLRGY